MIYIIYICIYVKYIWYIFELIMVSKSVSSPDALRIRVYFFPWKELKKLEKYIVNPMNNLAGF